MSKLGDVIAYICEHYPHKHELSKARLTKMVYLADWRSALKHGQQISSIEWVYNHYGPYVEDVISEAKRDGRFSVENTQNMYGDYKEVVSLKPGSASPRLSGDEKEILDKIIEISAPKYWKDFLNMVYSTYPILKSERYAKLDLVKLAREHARAL